MKPAITEKAFQASVVELARYCGWKAYHTFDSRRSDPGFLDLVLARHPQLVFAELKVGTNKLTKEQEEWYVELGAIADELQSFSGARDMLVRVWRPSDWPEIERVLRRR